MIRCPYCGHYVRVIKTDNVFQLDGAFHSSKCKQGLNATVKGNWQDDPSFRNVPKGDAS